MFALSVYIYCVLLFYYCVDAFWCGKMTIKRSIQTFSDQSGEFEDARSDVERVLKSTKKTLKSSITSLLIGPLVVSANEDVRLSLQDSDLRKGLVNVPSDDFWYPPYMIGTWNTQLKFMGANFTAKIPLGTLKENGHVPGFDKYSIIFLPDMGKDVSMQMRYVQLDSHTREDHPRNLRSLVKAFLPETDVQKAPYAFQKASTWFSAPSNKWHIEYQDATGRGQIDLLTRKRRITTDAGTVTTTEFIQQTHRREGQRIPVVGEYALQWRISAPASDRDEFVTTEALRRTSRLVGSLDVFAYLTPTDTLYAQEPKFPVAVYSYAVDMQRSEASEDTVYPFVPPGAGPVELGDFFGH